MMSSQRYKPNFRWLEQENGEKCIYDGDMLVGRLNEGPYPICFHDLRFIPGGSVFIKRNETMSPLGIAWRNQGVFNMVIDEITADQNDPEQLKLYFKMHDTGLRDYRDPEYNSWQTSMQQETWLDLTYDGELSSYVFTIKSRLTLKEGRVNGLAMTGFPNGLEYQDLLPENCFDRFRPHGNKKFQWFVYRDADGHLYKLPHTHHLGQDKTNIRFCEDGILTYVAEKEYNPVVELTGKTGQQTTGHICWWAWDFHFFLPDVDIASLTPHTPVEVNYKLYSLPLKKAKKILDEALLSPVLNIPEVKSPVYVINGVNQFEPSDDYRKPCDRWFWQSIDHISAQYHTEKPQRGHRRKYTLVQNHTDDSHCIWDFKEGYKTPGSLSIHRIEEKGKSFWVYNMGYAPHPLVSSRYHVRAIVKTKDVQDKAYLGWRFVEEFPNMPGKWNIRKMQYSSKKLKGDNEWQELALETSDAGGAVIASIFLILEGKGECWFDEVQVVPIK